MIYSQEILITEDPLIDKLLSEIRLVGEMNLLIEGESGVGKTPVARYANKVLTPENDIRPFVRINCAGLNRERLQDEMFGHKRGAFTGADTDRTGHVELAQGGDLFLDEIADLDLHCQAELLTFLDSGEYRKMGDATTRMSSCRIISATNKNLKEMVRSGIFRKDLYSRISQFKTRIPPLRERKKDIQPIMEHYIKGHYGYSKPYSSCILKLFLYLDWKEGNIRELRDAVTYMCYKSEGEEEIDLCHINPELYRADIKAKEPSINNADDLSCAVTSIGFIDYMERLEHGLLIELLKEEKSMRALARKIKLPHTTLQRKLKKYKLA